MKTQVEKQMSAYKIKPLPFQSDAISAIVKPLYAFLMILCVGTLSAFVSGPVLQESTEASEVIAFETAIGGAHLLFAGKYGGNIKKSEFIGQTELQVEGCAKGSRIFAFSLEVNRKGKITKLDAKSHSLTKEMVTLLNGLERGDAFEFKSTKAYMPNGKDVVDVSSQKFVVV